MANEQDKDNDMQENKKDKSRKSAILTGVICVLLCIIGALYIWHKQTQKPPVQLDVNSAIATVDIDKLMSKHSDYAKLEKLQAEKTLILIKLKSYALNTEQLQPPQVNPASHKIYLNTEQSAAYYTVDEQGSDDFKVDLSTLAE